MISISMRSTLLIVISGLLAGGSSWALAFSSTTTPSNGALIWHPVRRCCRAAHSASALARRASATSTSLRLEAPLLTRWALVATATLASRSVAASAASSCCCRRQSNSNSTASLRKRSPSRTPTTAIRVIRSVDSAAVCTDLTMPRHGWLSVPALLRGASVDWAMPAGHARIARHVVAKVGQPARRGGREQSRAFPGSAAVSPSPGRARNATRTVICPRRSPSAAVLDLPGAGALLLPGPCLGSRWRNRASGPSMSS